MIELSKIKESKHIVLISDNKSFSLANVLYSYILTLHKKVSLVVDEELDRKFAFLPWFGKVRKQVPSSCDLEIKISLDTLGVYEEFQSESIKINAKMATAFYSSLLIEDEIKSVLCESKKLSVLSELIVLGADCQLCYRFLRESRSLALFRMRAEMFANFLLKEDGTLAEVYIDDEILKKSGASLEDAFFISKELLEIVHVDRVVLIKQDENKVIKEIKGYN
ncbi:hypothetical protein [Sulfurimonas marina]|uniref:Phosphoesterase n=1 Tax=Sulfurimonas marina TaxID=2590551 RepID=A0A7M1AW21_9BACT|nr:hypothetical protein [Sulfurimonas marina]QOP41661.1 hypothetical protein FJR03_07870 [Sulfurimonas marina]